jgi:hypothetical protein
MATERLEDLTIEQLKKKDKDTTVLLIVCSISMTASFLVMTYSLGIVGVSMLGLMIVLVPLASGRKKIKEELKKRETAT